MVRFNAAVEIEKDEEKDALDKARMRVRMGEDRAQGVAFVRRAVGGSVARGFVKEVSHVYVASEGIRGGQLNRGSCGQVKAMLEVVDGRINSDADESSNDEDKAGWSDEEDDAGDDDRMDEDDDNLDDSDDNEEEDEPEPNIPRRKSAPAPVIVQPAFTTPKRRGRPPLSEAERAIRSALRKSSSGTNNKSIRTPTRTPKGTPRRARSSDLDLDLDLGPDLFSSQTPSRSVRSTRNTAPLYQTKVHPLDGMEDDGPAPPGQRPRMRMSDSDSSSSDDDRMMRMERTPSGRGVKRKSRSRSRSRMRVGSGRGKVRDEDAYVDRMEVEVEMQQRAGDQREGVRVE